MENTLLISDQQGCHILSWRFERDRLVALWEAKGISQDDVTTKIGTSKQHVSQWEIGKLVPTDILAGVFMSNVTNILLFMINLERK